MLLFIFVTPLVFVVVVSFFEYDRLALYPAFLLDNYAEIFASPITLKPYLKTFEYPSIVEVITVVVGFLVAYFLTFHVRTLAWRIGMLVSCTIPFFTSNNDPHDLVDGAGRRHLPRSRRAHGDCWMTRSRRHLR